MNRRQFLRLLPGFVFLPPAQLRKKTRERVFILEHYIAGFQHFEGPTVIQHLRVGDALYLKREPGNPHDDSAVAVYAGHNIKLGYISRYHNVVPAGMLDRGGTLEAMITGINPALSPPGKRVRFAVYHPVR